MATSFFLDTNALIHLSGIDESYRMKLSNVMKKRQIQICISHVQVDEKIDKEYRDYQDKINKALDKLKAQGIEVHVECTKEIIFDVSR